MKYRHVLVPLDGSNLSLEALPSARALAARFDADVQTVSVARDTEEAGRLRREVAARLGTHGDDRLAVVVADDPVAAIIQRAGELCDCAVCLSTHGRGRLEGAVIGSVARELLQRSREPIVALGPFADRRPGFVFDWPAPLSVNRLVACVDGSAPSETVLPVAAGWAATLDMSLTILTAAQPIPPQLGPGPPGLASFGPAHHAEEYVTTLAERWKGYAPDVSGEVVYDPISPARGIQTHLDRHPAGLLALTSHTRTGVTRVLLGAAAADIIHASVVPALVVPLPA